jgi:hypothetical protein
LLIRLRSVEVDFYLDLTVAASPGSSDLIVEICSLMSVADLIFQIRLRLGTPICGLNPILPLPGRVFSVLQTGCVPIKLH